MLLLKFCLLLTGSQLVVGGPPVGCELCTNLASNNEVFDQPLKQSFNVESFTHSGNLDFYVYVDVSQIYLPYLQVDVVGPASPNPTLVFNSNCEGQYGLRASFHSGCTGYCPHPCQSINSNYDIVRDLSPIRPLTIFNYGSDDANWRVGQFNTTVRSLNSSFSGYLHRVCIGWFGDCQINQGPVPDNNDCNDSVTTLNPRNTGTTPVTTTDPRNTETTPTDETGGVASYACAAVQLAVALLVTAILA